MLPLLMSSIWNLQGGWISALGFFDRGGSIVILCAGGVGGLAGAVVVGPRYGRYMSKVDKERIHSGSVNPSERIKQII